MKVVVVTGPESTGKSTLAAHLQRTYGGVLCGEYVRAFIDEHQRDTSYEDVPQIARGQLAWEDEARAGFPRWLWLDTHLLSNWLWSQTLFSQAPDWFETALRNRRYDFHLLLSPEGAPWAFDPQRCQPELADRLAFFQACRAWLEMNQLPYAVIDGPWEMRQRKAEQAIAGYFGQLP